MKVLFVYKYLTLGGVETVLKARLEDFRGTNIHAKIWFFRDGPGRSLFDNSKDEYLIGDLTDLRRYVEGWRPEIIDSLDSPEVLAILESLSYNPKLIFESHTPYPENRGYLKRLQPEIVERVLVPTEHQKTVIGNSLNRSIPINVIPNPVRDIFLKADTCFQNIPPNPILGWIGRLDNLKNWKLLTDIGQLLSKKKPNFEIWLIGKAGNRHSEQQAIDEFMKRGIMSKLKWFHQLSNERLPIWLDAIRQSGGVMLSTSKGEAFGMTIAEAMARACPVVVPSNPPFTEFIDNNVSGLTYPVDQPNKAAVEIFKLFENSDLHESIGQNARNVIRAKHAPSVCREALLQAFAS